MPKTNYVARHNGEIIGKRSTDRTYTHAVAVVYSEAIARSKAYDRMPSELDRQNFAFYERQITQEVVDQKDYSTDAFKVQITRTDYDAYKAIVDGGFDAYAESLRQAAIASFEKSKAAGGFEPCIVTWCGRPDLAMKEANKFRKEPRITHVAIIEVEKV